MAQYLLSVHYIEGVGATPAEEMAEAYAAVDVLNQTMMDQGVWVFGGGLEEPHTATVVRHQEGEFLVTDGPFPEAKEQLGGFWIIESPDLDTALDWAKKASVACRAPVEVRPFQGE